MTEKPRFKRNLILDEFEENITRYGNHIQTPVANVVLRMFKTEFERCYALLEEAERMAEYYNDECFTYQHCRKASEFLEKLSK